MEAPFASLSLLITKAEAIVEPRGALAVKSCRVLEGGMQKSIAIVGSGPTGIYTFAGLIDSPIPLRITLFEKGEKVGIGMPYSPEVSSRAMLANIASIEIPPLCQSYLAWLRALPDARLAGYRLKRADLHERLFAPRLLLGEFFRDQLMQLADQARARGHQVAFQEKTEITDIVAEGDALRLYTAEGAGALFDRVVLATGHDFQEDEPTKRGYFPNPWSGLIEADIGAVDVGVMGTSLSAIDTVMAVAQQHGAFERQADGGLAFKTDARGLSITMMSRNGLLPEADFYCPIPYAPLAVLTDAALAGFVETSAHNGGLDHIFALFAQELTVADPEYADQIGLAAATADDFADRYFAARLSQDPIDWARRNLAEVEHNKHHKITVPWRYAILRMHETLQSLLPALSDADRARFDGGLKRVFIDNYAAVPPESIRRLLALHDAGILQVAALGEDYDLTIGNGRTVVTQGDQSHSFAVFIDARGQKPLATEDLPFATLRAALQAAGQAHPEVDEAYHLAAPAAYARRLAFGAIPYLMHDKPFVQGITESHEIGQAIAKGVLTNLDARLPRLRRKWA